MVVQYWFLTGNVLYCTVLYCKLYSTEVPYGTIRLYTVLVQYRYCTVLLYCTVQAVPVVQYCTVLYRVVLSVPECTVQSTVYSTVPKY